MRQVKRSSGTAKRWRGNTASRRRSGGYAHRRLPWRRRRALRLLAALATAAGLIGGPVWLGTTGRLDPALDVIRTLPEMVTDGTPLTVRELLVEGRRRTSQDDIRMALDIHRGDSIFALDLDGAKNRLEALPWVAKAAVERRLPGTVVAELTEREPIGRWSEGGKTALVDRSGVVFAAPEADSFDHLPYLNGSGATVHAAALVDMLTSRPDMAARVIAAARRGNRRWDLVFRSGVVIRLPENDPQRAWDRLAYLDREYGLLTRGLLAIDMRLPDRLVLQTPRDVAPTSAAAGKNT